MTRSCPRLRRRRYAGLIAGLTAVSAVLLAGCTGIPSSSAPETIKPIPLGGPGGAASIAPVPDVQPRDLVTAFLPANATDPEKHASARAFLTPAARNRWTDSTATIIDGESIGNYEPSKGSVVVRGRVVGTLDASGIYTPSLQGLGDGGAPVAFEYRVQKVSGQFRIDKLRNGLVLTTDQFAQAYKPHNLYFFDLADRYLVPDQRWSALDQTQAGSLATWLVSRLADGPRTELQNAVDPDTLPTQANTKRLSVQVGSPTKIDIPGAGQLDTSARNRLAAQVSRTLDDVLPEVVCTITDGGAPVRIPAAGSAQFTESGFTEVAGPAPPAAQVYYLRNGKIVDENGKLLAGAVNAGPSYLNSVALARRGPSRSLSVAAVSGTAAAARLSVGTQAGGLRLTTLRGALSRPAFAPELDEVWVGDGPKLYRVTINSKAGKPVPVSVPSAAGGGKIVAVRLSAEGSRIAMVISSATGAQLFVGSVVRSAGQVRVDTLLPISPEGVVITDVAWLESLKLFAIGHEAATKDARVFETNVDGSFWNQRDIGTLPDAPDTVTAASGHLAWVSVGPTVWQQSGGGSWDSAGITGQTTGYDPIYLA